MKRAYALVEGQTEETFVRDVLGAHFVPKGLCLIPIILSTKRTKAGLKFKGGITSFAQVSGELKRLLQDSQVSVVTTMIDYYGLPEDFPVPLVRGRTSPERRALDAEQAFRRAVNDHRFLPYFSLHEFEALLFCDVHILGRVLQAPAVASSLDSVATACASPEDINDGPETHPAARILAVSKGYRKPLHGPIAAHRIGLGVLREKCPHFGQWLSRLEAIASR